eukprot:snap_masked-scaffold_5-processed-gene-5.42-mRNA-1 protein AED:1.00 eAED:1.00 QI:0/-1/0/0/-1/1/1/0/173
MNPFWYVPRSNILDAPSRDQGSGAAVHRRFKGCAWDSIKKRKVLCARCELLSKMEIPVEQESAEEAVDPVQKGYKGSMCRKCRKPSVSCKCIKKKSVAVAKTIAEVAGQDPKSVSVENESEEEESDGFVKEDVDENIPTPKIGRLEQNTKTSSSNEDFEGLPLKIRLRRANES